MVKSPSCFKIITCGKDSAERDDLDVTQGKSPRDKRGWSFRKKSARHRMLNNTVSTQSPTYIKEGSESATVKFESQPDLAVSDKVSVLQCNDEKPQLATFLVPEAPETVVKEEVTDTVVIEEVPELVGKEEVPDLAVKEEVPKTVVKKEPEDVKEEVPEAVEKEVSEVLVTAEKKQSDAKIDEYLVIVIQTAARGFLARRELHKIRKLVKLQAAVRGHIVRRHAVGTLRCIQAIVKMQVLVRARNARLSLEGTCPKSDGKEKGLNSSMEKLLSNKFARQMLESTPKAKPIHVKCNPSKPNSAWKWLERWMSASTVVASESDKTVEVADEREKETNVKFESLQETRIKPEIMCESADSKCSSVHESTVPSESEDNLIIYEADKFDLQACHYTTSSARENLEQPVFENTSTSNVRETLEDINAISDKDTQSQLDLQIPNESACEEPKVEAEQPKHFMKRLASEGNPAFLSAQTSFADPDPTLFYREAEKLPQDIISSEAQSVITTKEVFIAESPVHGPKNQIGGSECGTELSVTSTLDSPDRSDIGTLEHVPEANFSEGVICNPIISVKNSDNDPAEAESQQEKFDEVNSKIVTPIAPMDSPKVEPSPETLEPYVQAHVPSPEGSPRNHLNVPEAQETPSSQVSLKPEKRKSDRSGSGKKRPSLSAFKKSPPSTKHDSGSRSSVEKLPKEQKNVKRRTSFGSPKPESAEQEPRDSNSSNNNNSSNSLPHFMQATQSARAKLNANSSPRSSPDVQEGDNFLKKRHSLPGSNGNQGSSPPRAQKSKGNSERKWQR